MAICHKVNLPDGVVIICRRSRRSLPPKCYVCGRPSDRLCDFSVSSRKTCDRPLCSHCASNVCGDYDLCPEHARIWAGK